MMDDVPSINEKGKSIESFISSLGLFKSLKAQDINSQLSRNQLGNVPRADATELRKVFEKFASGKVDGQPYMTDKDFFVSYLELFPDKENYNKDSTHLLGGVLDQSKDGLISFNEFETFEGRLCMPDALYRTAFQLFDTNGNGTVSFDEFASIIKKTTIFEEIPFPFESSEGSDFVKLHFGKNKDRNITYMEFSQFLHDFHDAYAVVAFKAKDIQRSGFISVDDFCDVLLKVKSHLITDVVGRHMKAASSDHIRSSSVMKSESSSSMVSYSYFTAFISLLNNMELMKKVYLNASKGSRITEITKEEFLQSAQMMSQITPLEIEILYNLCAHIHETGTVIYSDLQSITPEQYMKQITKRLTEIQAVSCPEERGVFIQFLESAYRFALGSIAGAIGASAVYPIDLVKTRMQNQRTSYTGEVMYRNSMDCFQKVLRHEGFTGFYRGLLPQIMGVAPEKAIKLTVNDFVRHKYAEYNNNLLPLHAEILAGFCAGSAQVMFTNPLEIVKIRLQVAGEVSTSQKVTAWKVFKDLWFRGLYKGAPACLLRDAPFSAIFFPTYEHAKRYFADDMTGYNSPLSLFAAGLVAGAPAATLVTPADVVKTRLQVVARSGQTKYNGLVDAFRKIYAEEGFRVFWRGSVARMFRSSPQFAVTLCMYEILQRKFYIDFGGSAPTGSHAEVLASTAEMDKSENPHHIGGYQFARPIFSGIESKFGLVLPKFVSPSPSS